MVLAFDNKDELSVIQCQLVINKLKLNSFITAESCNLCDFPSAG